MNLQEIRKDYKQKELTEDNLNNDPFKQFELWLDEAIKGKLHDATAMSLATVSSDGFPNSRIVLLKDFNEQGFTFFTNYNSQKGKDLENNQKVNLLFFWPGLERQIRIWGHANKTSSEISKKYFHSRPVLSQIAASVSEQSQEISSREYLESKFEELQKQLDGKNPKYSSHWGGYIVNPIRFEFWQGRENRLHDRLCYEKTSDDKWNIKRLSP